MAKDKEIMSFANLLLYLKSRDVLLVCLGELFQSEIAVVNRSGSFVCLSTHRLKMRDETQSITSSQESGVAAGTFHLKFLFELSL